MGMDRGGALPANALVNPCFSGKTQGQSKENIGHGVYGTKGISVQREQGI